MNQGQHRLVLRPKKRGPGNEAGVSTTGMAGMTSTAMAVPDFEEF